MVYKFYIFYTKQLIRNELSFTYTNIVFKISVSPCKS